MRGAIREKNPVPNPVPSFINYPLYNFDVSEAWFQKFSTGCKNQLKVVLTLRGEVLSGGKFMMRQIYLEFTKYLQYITHMY